MNHGVRQKIQNGTLIMRDTSVRNLVFVGQMKLNRPIVSAGHAQRQIMQRNGF